MSSKFCNLDSIKISFSVSLSNLYSRFSSFMFMSCVSVCVGSGIVGLGGALAAKVSKNERGFEESVCVGCGGAEKSTYSGDSA